jgi:D-3-phosphoglycerate dehydrogenase
VDWPHGVARADTLPDLLGGADVLTLHVPLRPDTAGLIGAEELGMLPAGAVVVNTSRGEVLDEAALVDALASGRLGGAAVDVIAGESDEESRSRSPLLAYARDHDNVIVTPHLAGATVESMARTELFMAGKLAAFLERSGARTADPVPGKGM